MGKAKRNKFQGKKKKEQRKKPEMAMIFLIATLLAATFASYSPILKSGFIWDDDDYVTENICLRSFSGLGRIWFDIGATPQYYPLVHTSFWLEYQLWGLWAPGYHFINILLHGISAILVWMILKRLGIKGAFLGGMIFALHPVHVESVAWITERKNVLSGIFYLCATFFYIRFCGIAEENQKNKKSTMLPDNVQEKRRFYILSLIFFIFALLSKTVTTTLPAALLVIIWWKRKQITLKDISPLVPFFCVGFLFGLITIFMEKSHVGAKGVEWDLNFIERCLIAGRAIWFYAGKLVFPYKLSFIYPRWKINARDVLQYIYPLGVAFVLITLWITRKRTGKSLLAGSLFFIITLFPALGFINVYPMLFSFVADHFQYLASIGLIAIFCSLIYKITQQYDKSLYYMVFGCVVLMLGGLSWKQARIYRNPEILWRDTLKKNPNSWMPHNNLGLILSEKGKIDEAIWHYTKGIEIKPDDALGHYNLARVLDQKGDIEEAVVHYREAIRLNPLIPDALCNLGADLIIMDRSEEAEQCLKKALELKPDHFRALDNMGVLCSKKGNIEEAISYYEKALSINPGYDRGYYNMAVAYIKKNDPERALSYYRKAAAINPDFLEAHLSLGALLSHMGKTDEARMHFLEVLRLDPGNEAAQKSLFEIQTQAERQNVPIP